MPKDSQLAAITRRCGALAGVLAVMLAGVSTAQAEVIREEPFSVDYADTFELCGIMVRVEGTFSSTVHFRVGKGKVSSAFFVHERYRYSDTVTNLLTGKFFSTEGKGLVHDLVATHVEGNVFRFSTIEAGQTFAIRDSSGRLVLHDRGVIRTEVLFDTRGDAVPGGDEIEVISSRVSGPHPSFDEASFCATIQRLLL
jgi:hypothetical protein